jgi:hypothetical protein
MKLYLALATDEMERLAILGVFSTPNEALQAIESEKRQTGVVEAYEVGKIVPSGDGEWIAGTRFISGKYVRDSAPGTPGTVEP